MYKRIILKLSGETLAPEQLSRITPPNASMPRAWTGRRRPSWRWPTSASRWAL